jgi:hypothetical protein
MALKLIKLIVMQHNVVMLVGMTHTRPMIMEILIKEFNLLSVLLKVVFSYLIQ